jgi:hypothetical protein
MKDTMRDVSTSLDMTKKPEARVAEEIRKAARVFIERTRASGTVSKRD